MTQPVIIADCNTCESRTPHAREQRGEDDPPRVVTERICSECGTTETKTERITPNE